MNKKSVMEGSLNLDGAVRDHVDMSKCQELSKRCNGHRIMRETHISSFLLQT